MFTEMSRRSFNLSFLQQGNRIGLDVKIISIFFFRPKSLMYFIIWFCRAKIKCALIRNFVDEYIDFVSTGRAHGAVVLIPLGKVKTHPGMLRVQFFIAKLVFSNLLFSYFLIYKIYVVHRCRHYWQIYSCNIWSNQNFLSSSYLKKI